MANKHLHPESLTRLAGKGATCISKGLTPTPVMPLGLHPRPFFSSYVNGRSALCRFMDHLSWQQGSLHPQARTTEVLALLLDLHYHSEVAGKGGRLDPLYLSYLHGNLLPDHLWGTTSDCAELKVSFWPVKPSSSELRKDQETHNQKKQVMVTWQGSIFFPAPSPNHSTLVKAGKKNCPQFPMWDYNTPCFLTHDHISS